MTIDLGILKMRFCRDYVWADNTEPLEVKWTLVIGFATPSVRFFPMAWNLLAFDKRPESPMTIDFLRVEVGNG